MRFVELNKSCTYSTQALKELCGIRDGTIQSCNMQNIVPERGLRINRYLALTDDNFCMTLNCIYCIIYYVCSNLAALLRHAQYVRIKKNI